MLIVTFPIMALVLFTLQVATAGLAVLLFVLIFVLRVGSRPKDYPPGPPTLPLLGNLHLVSLLNLSRVLNNVDWAPDAVQGQSSSISKMGRRIRVCSLDFYLSNLLTDSVDPSTR